MSKQNPEYQSGWNSEETDVLDDGGTQLLNENDNFDIGCNQTQTSASGVFFCEKCGAELSGDIAFCTMCGEKVNSADTNVGSGISNSNGGQAQVFQPTPLNGIPDTQLPPAGTKVSRKEFIEKYAQPSLKKDIRNIAILCYVCSGLTFVASCFFNTWGFIDAFILLAFALCMHIGKSKVFAILLLVFSIVEVLVSLISGSFPFWWLVAGVSAVITFSKIDKHYKSFIANCQTQ